MASHDDLPPELRPLAARLEDERPELAHERLAHVRRRVLTRTRGAEPAPTRSRLAMTVALALGLVFSGGGVAMGVSALTSTNNASVAQYGAPVTPAGQTVPAPLVGDVGDTDADDGESLAQGGPAPRPLAEEAESNAVQPARQAAAAEDGELPFTGYAALPVLLLGLALLVTGVVLRRRSDGPATPTAS